MADIINTDGVLLTGEYEVRVQRDAMVEDDHQNAWRAGAKWALEEVALFTASQRAVAGPYDDMRAVEDLDVWIADRIREIHSGATNGNNHAA